MKMKMQNKFFFIYISRKQLQNALNRASFFDGREKQVLCFKHNLHYLQIWSLTDSLNSCYEKQQKSRSKKYK